MPRSIHIRIVIYYNACSNKRFGKIYIEMSGFLWSPQQTLYKMGLLMELGFVFYELRVRLLYI